MSQIKSSSSVLKCHAKVSTALVLILDYRPRLRSQGLQQLRQGPMHAFPSFICPSIYLLISSLAQSILKSPSLLLLFEVSPFSRSSNVPS